MARGPGVPSGVVPSRISLTHARALCCLAVTPACSARSAMTMAPMLCRLPAYFGPALPSPTTNQGSIVPPPPIATAPPVHPFWSACQTSPKKAGGPCQTSPKSGVAPDVWSGTTPIVCRALRQPRRSGVLGGGLAVAGSRLLALGSLLGLLVLDAGLLLGLGQLGLQGLLGHGLGDVDQQRLGVGH